MKKMFISVAILISMLFFACSKENPAAVKTGNLVIKNRSSAVAYVKINSGELDQIPANGSKTYIIDTGKTAGNRATASPVIHYYGNYLQEKTDTVSVVNGTTFNYNLDANCGLLRINNNCDSPISIFFSEDSLFTIDSNSSADYKFKPDDGLSTLASYTYKGLYAFPNTRANTVYTDVTTTSNVNPNAGALTIINDSNSLVDSLFIASASSNNWGPNRLTVDLFPGNSVTLTIEPGNYDIKLINLNETVHFIFDELIIVNQTRTVSYDGL